MLHVINALCLGSLCFDISCTVNVFLTSSRHFVLDFEFGLLVSTFTTPFSLSHFSPSSLLIFICFSPLQWVLQWNFWSVRLSVGSMMIWTRWTSLLTCSKSAVGRRFCRSESFYNISFWETFFPPWALFCNILDLPLNLFLSLSLLSWQLSFCLVQIGLVVFAHVPLTSSTTSTQELLQSLLTLKASRKPKSAKLKYPI